MKIPESLVRFLLNFIKNSYHLNVMPSWIWVYLSWIGTNAWKCTTFNYYKHTMCISCWNDVETPFQRGIHMVCLYWNNFLFCYFFNPLSANPTKWSNTLKQFLGSLPTNCFSVFDHFVGLALKGLILPCIMLKNVF